MNSKKYIIAVCAFFLGAAISIEADTVVVSLDAELNDQIVGGSCPGMNCVGKPCTFQANPLDCFRDFTSCYQFNAYGPCVKHVATSFARCSSPDAAPGMTCSETSSSGCRAITTSDPDDDGDCPQDGCDLPSGSCGALKYACAAISCST